MNESVVLAQHLIKTLHGTTVARVATELLSRGRLPFQQLCRLVYPVTPKDVRYSLLILLQHQLVWQYMETPYVAPGTLSNEPGADRPQGQDFYEANLPEILHRLSFGIYLGQAEELQVPGRPSSKGKSMQLIFGLLQHGRRRISDLLDQVSSSPNFQGSRFELQDVLTYLASERYIEATTPLQASCPLDRYRAIRSDKLSGHSTAAASSKAKRAADQAAVEEFIEERAGDLKAANDRMFGSSYVGPAVDTSASRKRQRGAEDDDGRPSKRLVLEISSALNEDSFIKVNYARFLFKQRSDWIENAAKSKFGRPAALILKACLTLVADDIINDPSTLRLDTPYSRTLKVEHIQSRLSELYEDYVHPHAKKQASPPSLSDFIRNAFVKDTTIRAPGTRGPQPWDATRQNTLWLIREILDGMAYSADAVDSEPEAEDEDAAAKPKPLLSAPIKPRRRNEKWLERLESQTGAWRIQFHAIHRDIKQALVLGLVEQEQGKEAVRILRILDNWGRLDEKTVQKIAMMTAKEVRKTIDALLHKDYIQSQECPRSNDRVSSRSMFLWYVDWPKVYQTVRGRILQELGNIATRKAAELQKHAIVLAKSQRPEVQANAELLEPEEWRAVEQLHEKMLYLRTAEQRALQDLNILDLPEAQLEDIQLV